MKNGISDFDPLSGDPGCTETIEEWAADRLQHLRTANKQVAKQTWKEMSPDEQDTILELCLAQTKKPS